MDMNGPCVLSDQFIIKCERLYTTLWQCMPRLFFWNLNKLHSIKFI